MRVTGNQIRFLVALSWMAVLVAISGYNNEAAGAGAVVFFLLLVPLGAWLVIFRARPAGRILRVCNYLRTKWKWEYYFETTIPAPANDAAQKFLVERRFLELLLPVLGVSAYSAEKITSVRSGSGLALAAFLGFAIVVLAVSSFMLIAIWVYEDSGFRVHGANSTTVGVPLNRVKSLLVYGGLGAYLSFSSTLAGSFAGGLALTIAVVVFFGPISYLVAILFDARMRRKGIRGVRERGKSKGFPFKSMSVS